MIPSRAPIFVYDTAVYQRGWMIDSQLIVSRSVSEGSISKGMDD